MTIRAGSKLDATDFALPDPVTGYANGENTISSTSFADLPTLACAASIYNPHPGASMLVDVHWGAWMKADANAVRCCPRVSGSKTIAAGIGGGGAIGWGEIPVTGSAAYVHGHGHFTTELPASANAAVFTMQAMRDTASGTQKVDYAVIRVVPLRYVFA